MPHPPPLQRFVDDELHRAAALAERVQAGALKLLRDVPPPGMARLEIDLNFAAAEALQRRAQPFRERFVAALAERVRSPDARTAAEPARGDELALIDDAAVQVDIEISRAMQMLNSTAEWELRELSTFTSALAGLPHVSPTSNPLGPVAWAGALWDATGALGDAVALRAAVLRVASGVLAGLLRTACAAACSRLQAQGIEPVAYRTVVLAAGSLPGRASVDVTQPGALHGLLAQMPGAQAEAPKDGVDPRIVDLLGRLFEAIQSDADLSPSARAPIARLQAAALRVALLDRTLLDAHDHPVWQLMDRIASALAPHPSPATPRGRAVLEACEAAVGEVTRAERPATADFRRAIAALQARLAATVEAERSAAAPAVAALERRERRQFLEEQFAARLAEQAAPVAMSAELRRFATGTWAAVLAECWLRHGEGGRETREMLRTVDDLLWSLQPPDHPQSRQRLLALLPSLLQRLRNGMALAGVPAPQEQAVLDELMAVHTAALKPRPGAAAPAALTPQQIVQQMRDEVIAAPAAPRPFVDSVIDIASMDTVPMDFLPTRPGEPEEPAAGRLDALQPGDRLELFLEGRWSHVQLLWRGDRAQHFLFAGESPGRTHPITRRALDRLAAAGLVRPVQPPALVQRAVDLLLRRAVLPT